MPRKFPKDPPLASWVNSQRILWNQEYRETGLSTIPASYPEPVTVQPYASGLPNSKDEAHDWELEGGHENDSGHTGGATAEDAALLVATMGEDSMSEMVEAQQAEVVAAAAAAAAEAVDDPPVDEEECMKLPAQPRLLSQERKDKLDALEFVWQPSYCQPPGQSSSYGQPPQPSVEHKKKGNDDRHWDRMHERLLKFRDLHGHCMVLKDYAADIELGSWAHAQRVKYRRMKCGAQVDFDAEVGGNSDNIADSESEIRLTEEQRRRLDDIGFPWIVPDTGQPSHQIRSERNSYDDQWDSMFNQLVAYKEKYGNCLVPKRFPANKKLGTWVDTQRSQHKKMIKKLAERGIAYDGPQRAGSRAALFKPIVGRLTDDRIRRLEDLGFVWSLRDDWDKHFEELKVYKAEHGHCNVPARYPKNRRLGIWVSAQRQNFKALQKGGETSRSASSRLSQKRIDQLNQLGFAWTLRSWDTWGESWHQKLRELKNFRALYGHCMVPCRYPPNPELGIWVGVSVDHSYVIAFSPLERFLANMMCLFLRLSGLSIACG